MSSRAGAATVQKLVGTTKSLLQGLEDALLLRAGFLAGTFHSWRCEAALHKVGRQFREQFNRSQEDWTRRLAAQSSSVQELRRQDEAKRRHAELVKMQAVRVASRFFVGGAKALQKEAWRAWMGLSRLECRRRKAFTQAEMAFLQSTATGASRMVLSSWHKEASHQKHLRELEARTLRSQQEVEEAQARLKQQLSSQAATGAASIMRKFLSSRSQGLLLNTWRGWQTVAAIAKAAATHSRYAQKVLGTMLEGSRSALLHGTFVQWRALQAASASERAERLRLEAMRHEHDARLQATAEARRRQKEAAHKSVEQMVRKWAVGGSKALKLGAFQEWCKLAVRAKAARRHKEAVVLSLMKSLEGDRRGLLHGIFLAWSHEGKREAEANRRLKETDELRAFLESERRAHARQLELHKDEAERRHKKAEAALLNTLGCWFKGDSKRIVASTFREWHKLFDQRQQKAMQHQNVAWALRLYFEGSKKAAVHMTFLNWKQLTQSQRHARAVEDAVERQRLHWEEARTSMMQKHQGELDGVMSEHMKRKDQAHATVEILLRQWAGGSTAGMLETVFADWRRLAQLHRQARHVAHQVEHSFWRSCARLSLACWRAHVAAAVAARSEAESLQKQVEHLLRSHKGLLGRYLCTLGGASTAVGGMAFAAWKELAAAQHREKLKLHLDATRTRQDELRLKALSGLGLRGRRAVLLESFKAWQLVWEKMLQALSSRIAKNESMHKLAGMISKQQHQPDRLTLLSTVLAEWHRESLRKLQHTCHSFKLKADESSVYAGQLEQRLGTLEEQLWLAYQEIDRITHTMQKEIECKEELTAELREAYVKVRQQCLSPVTLNRGRGSSASRGRGPLQAPASLLAEPVAVASGRATPASAEPTIAQQQRRSVSPRCDWDEAVRRMRAEGLVRADDEPRI